MPMIRSAASDSAVGGATVQRQSSVWEGGGGSLGTPDPPKLPLHMSD